jgi:hypothetical protein
MATSEYTFRFAIEQFLQEASDYSGFISDDNVWSKRHLMHKIIQLRAGVIDSFKNEPYAFSEQMYQAIQCIEMEEVDQQLCPCAPASGCFWLRSKEPVPKPLVRQYVGGTMGENFHFIKWSQAKRIPDARRKAEREAKYYTLREAADGDIYVYVWNDKYTPQITMEAIFENPLNAAVFPQCDKDTLKLRCYPLDCPIFLDQRFVEAVEGALKQTLLPTKLQSPSDGSNNDRADVRPPVKVN